MAIILSLSKNVDGLWAAGPEGLYLVTDGDLQQVPQPQQNLYCCCAIHDRLLAGGLPHGIAFNFDNAGEWQAGWMDNLAGPVVMMGADPQVETSGVILAATDGGGILRTSNRGRHWFSRNFGLRSYSVLALAWAPVAPAHAWPRWQNVFACTDEGLYRSPNGGRGWKRAECDEAVYQCLAVSPDFHTSGTVLAGTEESGLHRSTDGGRTFQRVADAPEQINALAATSDGWLLSDADALYHSPDGVTWSQLSPQPALVLLTVDGETWAGTEDGVRRAGAPELAA